MIYMWKTKYYYMFMVMLWFIIAVTTQKGDRVSIPVVYQYCKTLIFTKIFIGN